MFSLIGYSLFLGTQLANHNMMFFLRFLDVSDASQVTESLKEHAIAVREPPVVRTLLVTSNP